MNAMSILLLIAVGIVVVFSIVVGASPKIRGFLFPSTKKESVKKQAQEAVNEIISKDLKESKIDEEIKIDKIQKYLLQKEKELGFILSEDDINPLIIQLLQDEKDNKR